MALEYKVKISPTLDSDKAKEIIEILRKAFADGKIDVDMSPLIASMQDMSGAVDFVNNKVQELAVGFQNVMESVKIVSSNIVDTANTFGSISSAVENTSESFDKVSASVQAVTDSIKSTTENTKESADITELQVDQYLKIEELLGSINDKIYEYSEAINNVIENLDAMNVELDFAKDNVIEIIENMELLRDNIIEITENMESFSAIDMSRLVENISKVSEDFSSIIEKIESITDGIFSMSEAFSSVRDAAENITENFNNVNDSAVNFKDNIDKSKSSFEQISSDADKTSESFDNAADSVNKVTINIERAAKSSELQNAQYDKMSATLSDVNIKIQEQISKIADAKDEAIRLGKSMNGVTDSSGAPLTNIVKMENALKKLQADAVIVADKMSNIGKSTMSMKIGMESSSKASALLSKSLLSLSPPLIAAKLIMDLFQDIIGNIMEQLKTIVGNLTSGLMPALQPILDIASGILMVFKPLLDIIFAIVGSGLDVLFKLISLLIEPIAIGVKALVDGFMALVTPIMKIAELLGIIPVGTAEATAETLKLKKVYAEAVAEQENILQALQEGEQVTSEQISKQKDLLKYLDSERQKRTLTSNELEAQAKAQQIISQNNILHLNQLKEQVESGKDISWELAKQSERQEYLNKLQANGTKLQKEQKKEVEAYNEAVKAIATYKEKQKNDQIKSWELDKEMGKLSKESIGIIKQRIALLKEELLTKQYINVEDREAAFNEMKRLEKILESQKKSSGSQVDIAKKLNEDLQKIRDENIKQTEKYNAMQIENAYERNIELLNLERKYAQETINTEIERLQSLAEKDKKHRQLYLDLIQENKNKELQLQVEHTDKLVKMREEEFRKVNEAFTKAQDKFRVMLDKARADEINNRIKISEENIKLQEDEANKLAEKRMTIAIKEAEDNARLLKEAAQERARLNTESAKQRGVLAEEELRIAEELASEELQIQKDLDAMLLLLNENTNKEILKNEENRIKKIAVLNIQAINDNVERERASKIAAINEEFEIKKKQYADNKAILERLEKERLLAIAKINAEIYARESKKRLDAVKQQWALEFEIAKQFTDKINNYIAQNLDFDKRTREFEKGLEAQEKALRASYLRRELTDEQYHLKRVELEMNAEEEIARMRQERTEAMLELVNNSFDTIADTFRNYSQKVIEEMALLSEYIEDERTGQLIKNEEWMKKNEELNAIMYAQMGAVAGQFFANMISGNDSMLKNIVVSTLKMLDAMVNIWAAKIFANEVSTKGMLGIPTALALTAAMKALIAVAQASKFYKGGLITDGVRHKDSTYIHAAKDEFIVNNKAVLKENNLQILEEANKKNRSIVDIVFEKYISKNNLQILEEANKRNMLIRDIVLNKEKARGFGAINLNTYSKFSESNSDIIVNNKVLERQMKLTNYKLDTLINIMDDNNLITENTNKILKKDSDTYAKEVRNKRLAKVS